MKNLLNLGFTSKNGIVNTTDGTGVKFLVERAPIGEKFIMDNPLTPLAWTVPLNSKNML